MKRNRLGSWFGWIFSGVLEELWYSSVRMVSETVERMF